VPIVKRDWFISLASLLQIFLDAAVCDRPAHGGAAAIIAAAAVAVQGFVSPNAAEEIYKVRVGAPRR
jgi:hypothetical protein